MEWTEEPQRGPTGHWLPGKSGNREGVSKRVAAARENAVEMCTAKVVFPTPPF